MNNITLDNFRNDVKAVIPDGKTFKKRISSSFQESMFSVISKYLPELKDSEIRKIGRAILLTTYEDCVEIVLTCLKNSYKIKGLQIFRALRLEEVKLLNEKENIEPEIDRRYFCESCGRRDGKCHPTSGYCYHCRTDNWKLKED